MPEGLNPALQRSLKKDGVKEGARCVRMILTGTAGSGKSRTVRSCVQARKALARARHLQEQRGKGMSEEKACKDADDFAEDVVSLAAPTGCAAFQMKSGASDSAPSTWRTMRCHCKDVERGAEVREISRAEEAFEEGESLCFR